MFDLSALALNETTVLHLLHPVEKTKLFAKGKDGQPDESKPVTIELYGSASKQYRNAVDGMQARKLRRDARKEKVDLALIKEESLKLLLACSATSTNLSVEGAPVLDEAAFRKLYSDAKYSWVRDQVDEALGDPANFLAQ